MKKLILSILLLFALSACKEAVNENLLTDTYKQLIIPTEITEDTRLPQTVNGIDFIWSSDIEGLLRNNQIQGILYDSTGVLTASITYDGVTLYKSQNITVSGTSDQTLDQVIIHDVIDQFIKAYTYDEDFSLPQEVNNVRLSYSSNDILYITNELVVTQPLCSIGEQVVTLTVTASLNEHSNTFNITVTIPCIDDAPIYTGYYAGMDGLEGDLLKQFLHDLIDDHHVLTYDEVKYALRDTDEDPNNPNNVILFYTGDSHPKTDFGGDPDQYNREHVWAKSHGGFGNDMGPGTDLHHIRPTDVSVNGARGSLDFDNGGSIVYDGSTPTENKIDSDSFEPRDEVKGDVARMLFYMAVRYEGDDYLDLELSSTIPTGSSPTIGDLETLLAWHLLDPVDDFEMDRNDAIYSYQGNRNPFIDHPELVELIWGD